MRTLPLIIEAIQWGALAVRLEERAAAARVFAERYPTASAKERYIEAGARAATAQTISDLLREASYMPKAERFEPASAAEALAHALAGTIDRATVV